jgi:hypothetical protein
VAGSHERIVRSISLVPNAATILLLLWIPNDSFAYGIQQQVCDFGADRSLGIEDYSEAIRLHIKGEPARAERDERGQFILSHWTDS